MRAWADCILASIESRSVFSLRISPCTDISDDLAESASFWAVSSSAFSSPMSAVSWFFFCRRISATSSWLVSSATPSSASVCASSFAGLLDSARWCPRAAG